MAVKPESRIVTRILDRQDLRPMTMKGTLASIWIKASSKGNVTDTRTLKKTGFERHPDTTTPTEIYYACGNLTTGENLLTKQGKDAPKGV